MPIGIAFWVLMLLWLVLGLWLNYPGNSTPYGPVANWVLLFLLFLLLGWQVFGPALHAGRALGVLPWA
jgi:hypothetical protein